MANFKKQKILMHSIHFTKGQDAYFSLIVIEANVRNTKRQILTRIVLELTNLPREIISKSQTILNDKLWQSFSH